MQHLQYLPFGEPFVNEQIAAYSERFTFTGKEKDIETGYYYFGARFDNVDLGFMSVDPLADKYPSISPYAYCAWNPVKLVDPDGRDWYESEDVKNKQKVIKWTDCHSQEEMDRMNINGKYIGLTYMDRDNSTYYNLYGKEIRYDNNNPTSIEMVNKLAITDNLIINAVNSYKGVRSFWDKHNDMIEMFSSYTSAMANLTKNTRIDLPRYFSFANSVFDYVNAFTNGTWDNSNTTSAVTDIISIVAESKWINRLLAGKGGFYAAIINYYIYGTIWASKKGAEVESSLRNYFSPNSSNNYYQNIFGY